MEEYIEEKEREKERQRIRERDKRGVEWNKDGEKDRGDGRI